MPAGEALLARTEKHIDTLRKLCAPRNIQLVLLITQIDKLDGVAYISVPRLLRNAALVSLRNSLLEKYQRISLLRNNLESSLSNDTGVLVWHSLKTIVEASLMTFELRATKK